MKKRIHRSQAMIEIDNRYYHTSDDKIARKIIDLVEREIQKWKYTAKFIKIQCCNMGLDKRFLRAIKAAIELRIAMKYNVQVMVEFTKPGKRAPTAVRLAAYFARDMKRRFLSIKKLFK